ncbi:MAG: FAD-dependent oxidoreductase [Pseudomonadota bacterium]
MTSNSVVIVGGGYVGVELAKALEGDMNVTLVEPRAAFVHAPAMIRSIVDPSVLGRALIPYDTLLKKGRVVRDRATAIQATGVTLAGGEELAADFVVVATGSTNGAAFKPEGDSIEDFQAAQARTHEAIKAASKIAIVGAGAVGTELAGEIAHAMPAKKVTLISDGARLFPKMPDKLGNELARKLGEMGVALVLGTRVEDLASTTEPFPGPLTLSTGQVIDADLVIPAIGSRANTALLDGLPGVRHGGGGRVKVDAYLRPSDYPNLFVAGDVADAGDAMTIVAISRQQPWLAKTLKHVAAGKPIQAVKPYTPWGKAPILVPLGPERGNSFLMIATLGDRVTRMMKGRDLFIPKYRKILGKSA